MVLLISGDNRLSIIGVVTSDLPLVNSTIRKGVIAGEGDFGKLVNRYSPCLPVHNEYNCN